MTATHPMGRRGPRTDRTASHAEFVRAQRRILERHGVDAASRYVELPRLGIRAHVLVSGDGPPVVMAIGGGMVAALWAPLMAQLAGYRLIAFDLPGHGSSDPVRYTTERLRSTAVTFLDDLLNGVGIDRAPIVAQSMGGLWSTWFALDRPDRVSAISYIGCPALMLGTSAPLALRLGTIRWLHHLLERIQPPSPAQVERMGRMAGEDLGDLPEVRDLFVAYERLPTTSAELLDLHRAALRVRGPRREVELTAAQLRSLRRPVQFVWGEHDPFGSPEIGRRAADIVADAEFHLVEGGHGPWLSHSASIGPLVSTFLAGHP